MAQWLDGSVLRQAPVDGISKLREVRSKISRTGHGKPRTETKGKADKATKGHAFAGQLWPTRRLADMPTLLVMIINTYDQEDEDELSIR